MIRVTIVAVLVVAVVGGGAFYWGTQFGGGCDEGTEVVILGPGESREVIDGEVGYVIKELEYAKDIHESYLHLPPSPVTGSYEWHERWVELYEKAISILGEY